MMLDPKETKAGSTSFFSIRERIFLLSIAVIHRPMTKMRRAKRILFPTSIPSARSQSMTWLVVSLPVTSWDTGAVVPDWAASFVVERSKETVAMLADLSDTIFKEEWPNGGALKGLQQGGLSPVRTEVRAAINNAAATPLKPVPKGCCSESEIAALAKAIRHLCRKAFAALRCSDLKLHHLIIPL